MIGLRLVSSQSCTAGPTTGQASCYDPLLIALDIIDILRCLLAGISRAVPTATDTDFNKGDAEACAEAMSTQGDASWSWSWTCTVCCGAVCPMCHLCRQPAHQLIVSHDAGDSTDSEGENTEDVRPSRGLPVPMDSQDDFWQAQMTDDTPEEQIQAVMRKVDNIVADANGTSNKLIHLFHCMPVNKPQGSCACTHV